MLTLPVDPLLEFQSFTVQIDGAEYSLELRWNERDAAWFLTLRDANDAELLAGRRVVVGYPLLARFVDVRLPAGELTAVDTTGLDAEPLLGELGRRVELVYLTVDDLGAVEDLE